jgi:hypothetical protein
MSLLTHLFIFPSLINYNLASWCNKSSTHSLLIWFWLKVSFSFLKIMVSCMATYYGPQVAQVNEESASKSFLDLTLTQHPCDEDLESWEVRIHLEVDPPRTWYYCISSNPRTPVILMQIDPISHDEPETVYEGCYETEDTFIFAWSSIFNVGHYYYLRGPICQLPFKQNKLPSSHYSMHRKFPTIMNYHYGIA